jgi:hypothetical protein
VREVAAIRKVSGQTTEQATQQIQAHIRKQGHGLAVRQFSPPRQDPSRMQLIARAELCQAVLKPTQGYIDGRRWRQQVSLWSSSVAGKRGFNLLDAPHTPDFH